MIQTSLLIIVAAFLTAILSGVFGMAGGLVFMGVLAWLLPAGVALALHGVIQFASNLWRATLHRRHIVWPVLLWFGLGAAVSVGVFSLLVFAPTRFAVFLGLGLLPILVWIPERWLRLDAANRGHAVGGGFVSTGLSLVSGVSGPVTDLLFVNSSLTRHQVVATKAVMQAIGHASKIIVYGGVLLGSAARAAIPLSATAIAILASMAGIMVGGVILDRISEAHFRASRRWIVTIVGLTFLVQAARLAAA
ncbi:sulfite exporter TauE/SafE family protein [Sphingopyxis sp. KK2]|uniref:sulfite exporter TauE/SafE family protein n=1 Tax=Sphingopyxis sp. KK2 TaxID=1855727 RepID=UPI00097E7234|nr:sulfite exporter TauE/SafE family protein [Sphingopyxis sp. KK2]